MYRATKSLGYHCFAVFVDSILQAMGHTLFDTLEINLVKCNKSLSEI